MSDAPDITRPGVAGETESLADVLASIRALVSAETAARLAGGPGGDVMLLTPQMRLDGRDADLAEGIDGMRPGPGAPILDEEALRGLINALVREELQGELGERINRNLRKLIRRELTQMLAEMRAEGQPV